MCIYELDLCQRRAGCEYHTVIIPGMQKLALAATVNRLSSIGLLRINIEPLT